MLLYYGLIPLFILVTYCFISFDTEVITIDNSIDLYRITTFYKSRAWLSYIIPLFCTLMVVGHIYWIYQFPNWKTIASFIILMGTAMVNNGPNVVDPLKILVANEQKSIEEKRVLWRKVAYGHLIDIVCFIVVVCFTFNV